MSKLTEAFYLARKVSAPYVVVRTSDPTATIAALSKPAVVDVPREENLKIKAPTPLVAWDTQRGIFGLNELGVAEVKAKIGQGAGGVLNFADAVFVSLKLPKYTVIFFHNAHRFWTGEKSAAEVQAVANLRESFKANWRTAVFLTLDGTPIPREFAGDVITMTDELPTRVELEAVIASVLEQSGISAPAEQRKRAVDAVAGLNHFSAEQQGSMALVPDGFDLDRLWEGKRDTIEQTPGLTVRRDGIKFGDVIGCANVKKYLRGIVDDFNAILFIDEIEKGLAGWSSDTSGVSQDFHQNLLQFLDSPHVFGVLLVGYPGTGKTMTATALGNEVGIPTVVFDMGAMKGRHVGDSEGAIRNGLAVTKAIGQGRILVLATSNGIANLSAEIRRRFSATFFFDLPSKPDLAGVWQQYIAKPHVDAAGPLSKAQSAELPEHTDWTPAEVKRTCEAAWRLKISLVDAATYVVPIARAMPAMVEKLRQEADGAYINAAAPGTFQHVAADIRGVHPVGARALAAMRES